VHENAHPIPNPPDCISFAIGFEIGLGLAALEFMPSREVCFAIDYPRYGASG
jgi:hypothetical protein